MTLSSVFAWLYSPNLEQIFSSRLSVLGNASLRGEEIKENMKYLKSSESSHIFCFIMLAAWYCSLSYCLACQSFSYKSMTMQTVSASPCLDGICGWRLGWNPREERMSSVVSGLPAKVNIGWWRKLDSTQPISVAKKISLKILYIISTDNDVFLYKMPLKLD